MFACDESGSDRFHYCYFVCLKWSRPVERVLYKGNEIFIIRSIMICRTRESRAPSKPKVPDKSCASNPSLCLPLWFLHGPSRDSLLCQSPTRGNVYTNGTSVPTVRVLWVVWRGDKCFFLSHRSGVWTRLYGARRCFLKIRHYNCRGHFKIKMHLSNHDSIAVLCNEYTCCIVRESHLPDRDLFIPLFVACQRNDARSLPPRICIRIFQCPCYGLCIRTCSRFIFWAYLILPLTVIFTVNG